MPISTTFFYHEEDYEKPTMTIYLDGSCKEHGLPFLRRLRCVAQLEKYPRGPTRAQLDTVEMISAFAVAKNPYCVLTYKCLTSPWSLDHWRVALGQKFLDAFAGPGLPWPKALKGPLHSRGKKAPWKPTPVKKPSAVIRLASEREKRNTRRR